GQGTHTKNVEGVSGASRNIFGQQAAQSMGKAKQKQGIWDMLLGGGGSTGGDNTSGVGEVTDIDVIGDSANNLVAENADVGTYVGLTASATDSDAGDTVTYTLSDDGDGMFVINSVTGMVSLAAKLDFETAITHNITVVATSIDGTTSNETFVINVGDNDNGLGGGFVGGDNTHDLGLINDIHTGGDADTNLVSENAPLGTPVGITALAIDEGDTVSYSLSDDVGGLFAIDSSTGVVTLEGDLDYTLAQSHTISVSALSSDGTVSSETFTINVGQNNEGAGDGTNIGAVTDVDATIGVVSENAIVGTNVGITANAIDDDPTDRISYSLDDDAGGLFTIDVNSGVVSLANMLDYETAISHDIIVRATSSDGTLSTATFSIDVGNNDEGIGGGTTGGDNTTVVGPVTDVDVANNLVSENANVGTEIGITASAIDVGDSLTYSLSDDALGLFDIDSSTGVVTLAGTLDFDSAQSHDITVDVLSSDGSVASETFSITVGENNAGAGGGSNISAITDVDAQDSVVSENAIIGTDVGITAQANDADNTDTISYTLSDDANGLFTIDSATGVVSLANTLDYESATSHNIIVVASSSDGTTSSETFTVTVGDNDTGLGGGSTGGDNTHSVGPVLDIDVSGHGATNLVSENAPLGTEVGITALATDVGDTVTYTLSDDAAGLFTIDGTTGVVSVAGNLDYSAAQFHSVTIVATSTDGSTSDQIFTISVGDNNTGAGAGSDIGSVIDVDVTASLVSENAMVGTQVGITAQAIDSDSDDTINYRLDDDAAGLFVIDNSTGVFTLANTLDYETAITHSIIVTAVSSDGTLSSETFIIDVGNNDTGIGGGSTGGDNTMTVGPVTDINILGDAQTNLVSEQASVGTPVGITAQATDIGDSVTYHLSDNANGLFRIDGATGVVILMGSLDFDAAPSHSITVVATSSDGSVSSETFSIVVGQNDTGAGDSTSVGAITDIDATVSEVSEHAIVGTAVGITAQAIDDDVNDTVTYSLSDDSDGLFSIDATSGVVILANTLDYETATSHDIIVVATSSDGSTSQETFTIAVGDNNVGLGGTTIPGDGTDSIGPVTDIDILGDAQNNLISENAVAGSNVGITASAIDAGDTLTYSLTDDSNGLFSIDSTSGVVTLVGSLDFDVAPSHSITVQATSTDGSTSNETFQINVGEDNAGSGDGTNVGDISDIDATTGAVSENAIVGTAVGITANAIDGDPTDTVTYSLGDDAGGLFAIDSATGVVTLANTLDYESAISHDIVVTATSTDGSTTNETFVISVADNDTGIGGGTSGGDNTEVVGAISDINVLGDAATNLVSENAQVGTAVGITALAVDEGDVVTYSLSDDANGMFSIDGATGVVTLLTTLDYIVAKTHDITVLATSTDGSTSSETFTINVGENDNGSGDTSPVGNIIDVDLISDPVSENASVGTAIGITAQALDGDPSDSVTYTLSNDADGLFTIDSNSGVITLANPLDYETATSHDISVVATSSDGSSTSETFTVNVGDDDSGIGGGSTGGDNTHIVGPVTDIDNAGDAANNLVAENADIGTQVGITASASDVGDTLTYTLVDDAGGLFVIDANSGVVTLNGVLDLDSAPSHDITVLATSSDG
ncbi:MAG: cadherin repeat domain-containing protein, partial [Psychrobium sp.]|nr:cadherin repeat domain-containing protein [Psychrobium sp.]